VNKGKMSPIKILQIKSPLITKIKQVNARHNKMIVQLSLLKTRILESQKIQFKNTPLEKLIFPRRKKVQLNKKRKMSIKKMKDQ
jgi:hypothetical protein